MHIIMKALNGFLTQRQMTLKDACWYISLMSESFIGHVCETLSYSWYCRYDLASLVVGLQQLWC